MSNPYNVRTMWSVVEFLIDHPGSSLAEIVVGSKRSRSHVIQYLRTTKNVQRTKVKGRVTYSTKLQRVAL